MLNRWSFAHVPALRQILTHLTYQYVSWLDRHADVVFMNYGFAELDDRKPPLDLPEEDERHRYEIQLYHHISSAVSWAGMDALEVSSGRGGGAAYIMRRFCPRSLVGLDFASNAVKFCSRYYDLDGLSFLQGNAEDLRFADASFDIVLNVEASFYYPHIERFFAEVVRVLRPGGHFLYADMRYAEELGVWAAQLDSTGLELLHTEDITPNVVCALALSRARKQDLIRRHIPPVLHEAFAEFAGITGAGLASEDGRIGQRTYRSYVFRKPAVL